MGNVISYGSVADDTYVGCGGGVGSHAEEIPTKNEKAACTASIGEHYLRFYRATAYSEARFEATCYDPRHTVWDAAKNRWVAGRCRLTRHLSEGNMKSAASRPVGLMVAWLLNAEHFHDFSRHQDRLLINCTLLGERQSAREWFRTQPNGAVMMGFERAKGDDEGEEPVDCP